MCTVIDGNGMCALGYVQPQKRHLISVAVLSGHKIATEESDNSNFNSNSMFVEQTLFNTNLPLLFVIKQLPS